MRVIFNADDFGLTEGVNLGILKAFKDGVVKSTTLMVNMPFAEQAVKIANENPELGVGVHLTVTAGPQLIKIKNSLVDENGDFHNKDLLYDYQVKLNEEELYCEWKTQINKFIELMGKKPTHIDSHHHIHLIPKYLKVALKLAEEYGIPMREQKWDNKNFEYIKLKQDFIYDGCKLEYFINHEDELLKEDVIEVMCHPAFIDQNLLDKSSYNLARCGELSILTSIELKEWISKNKIKLINYGEIMNK
ncbi:chitin disaccharide deacetylase [uncultured Clostridium sp.]|uniref:chitin disaccharide deacetylase n=1 Tax=uncultured Clostridium sp. TaxID=59620 RepID=UPI002602BF13|nr:chitin disaccharide deacetylase [uncultured Clostridium sp.]